MEEIFLASRRIVESYMKVSTCSNEAQKASPISKNNNQPAKYRALSKNFMQLRPDCQ